MLSNSAVRQEFNKIINSPAKATIWDLKAALIIDDEERFFFRDVVVEKIVMDFTKQMGDNHFITLKIGGVTYREIIEPNKHKLKMRVQRELKSDNPHSRERGLIRSDVYEAYLTDATNLKLSSNSRSDLDRGIEEASGLLDITFQLVEPELFYLINKDTAGSYPNTDPVSVLCSQLMGTLRNRETTSGLNDKHYKGVRGLRFLPSQNDKTYKNIIVPTGTRLKSLPRMLQNRYGIYSAGIGTYYQTGYWYVYSLFDFTRFPKAERTLSIYNVPPEELPTIDTSFSVRDTNTFILSTGFSVSDNQATKAADRAGDGLKFTPSDVLEGQMFTASGNRVKPKGSETSRVIGVKKSERGVQNIRHVDGRYTDNPFPYLSKQAESKVEFVRVKWVNCDPAIVSPAMPVRVFYANGEDLEYVEGSLVGCTFTRIKATNNIADDTYYCNADLVIAVEEK
jgi:hypothetical protein